MITAKQRRNDLALVSLVVANLIPLVGVLFFELDTFSVLVLFWAEIIVIGLYSILKIIKVSMSLKEIFIALTFFSFLYVLPAFYIINIIFYFYGGPDVVISENNIVSSSYIINATSLVISPIIALFISHGISYLQNFIRKKEYTNMVLGDLVTNPLKRVTPTIYAVLLGSISLNFLEDMRYVFVAIIIIKTVYDIKFHKRERRDITI